jgi:hypothetical protein
VDSLIVKKTGRGNTIMNHILLHADNSNSAQKAEDENKQITGVHPCSIVTIYPGFGMLAGKEVISLRNNN